MAGVGFTKNEKVSTTHHSLRILRTHTAISIHLLRLFSTDFFTETRRLRRTAANCGLEPYGISVLYCTCTYVPGECTSTYLYILRIILRFPDLYLKSDDEWWWWWLMTRWISRFLDFLVVCCALSTMLCWRHGGGIWMAQTDPVRDKCYHYAFSLTIYISCISNRMRRDIFDWTGTNNS